MKSSYLIINLVFSVLIVLIILYSYIFSAEKANHPIVCVHFQATGKQCPSCGISRSFSEIVRLKFDSSENYNPNGIPVFLFILSQLFFRLFFSFLLFKKIIIEKKLVIIDVSISTILFLFAFKNFIVF